MDESIGGLWIKQGKNGKPYMSGKIKIGGNEYPLVIFGNDKGDNPSRPDYKVYMSKPMGQAGAKPEHNSEVPF